VVLSDAGVLVHPEGNSCAEHLGHSIETSQKPHLEVRITAESQSDDLVLRRETECIDTIKS